MLQLDFIGVIVIIKSLLLIFQNCIVNCDGDRSDILEFNWEPLSSSLTSPASFSTDIHSTTATIEEQTVYPVVNRKNRRVKFGTPYIYQNRVGNSGDELESDFGTWASSEDNKHADKINKHRRPKFQTHTYNTSGYQDFNTQTKMTYIQKIPTKISEPASNTRKQINNMLKNYLAKLYTQKYMSPADHKKFVDTEESFENGQESKFLDGALWGFKNKTLKFANKFLSLFTVVQFDNFACTATSSNIEYMGFCYHQTQCDNMNGTAIGNCANGYGVCCVFRNTCGGSSSQNCTYFENPGYPNYDPPDGMMTTAPPATTQNPSPTPDPRFRYYPPLNRWARQSDTTLSCSYMVYKTSDDVQQMRIDFLDLELTAPTNGTCRDERLVISGQGLNTIVPIICGYNTGQFIYVDVSQLSGPLQISVLSATAQRKRFRLRICQLAMTCANSNNCLQYYTGITGTISSFNYDQASVLNRSVPGYFNNLNYAICIRKEAGYCSITYTNMPTGVEYPFQFRNVDDAGRNIVPPGQAGVEIFNCPDDYIVIGGTRLCGDKFNDGAVIEDFTRNAPVTDSGAGPIVVQVRTNEAVSGRGFKLFYTQNRCTMMMT